MRNLCLTLIILAFPIGVTAQDGNWKLRVDQQTLIYDTETDQDGEIHFDDIGIFNDLMRANPGVTTLRLNSGGGNVWAGTEIARIALDYSLDTVVDGMCSSSCVDIFLGGENRTMTRGSKIGFHLRSWSPAAIEEYYNSWSTEEGWDTPFELSAWIYRDTQAEVYDSLSYLISRGVDPEFAIKSKMPRESTWFPVRSALIAARVLTE